MSNYFRHVDGGIYRLVAHAKHADDASPVVVYEHLWPFQPAVWVRRVDEWHRRFQPISDADAWSAMQVDRERAQAAVKDARHSRRIAEGRHP